MVNSSNTKGFFYLQVVRFLVSKMLTALQHYPQIFSGSQVFNFPPLHYRRVNTIVWRISSYSSVRQLALANIEDLLGLQLICPELHSIHFTLDRCALEMSVIHLTLWLSGRGGASVKYLLLLQPHSKKDSFLTSKFNAKIIHE